MMPHGGCHCKPGFEPHDDRECRRCPVGHYKPNRGQQLCARCPPNSHAGATGSAICDCDPGFWRSEADEKTSGCTKPPSSPRNLSTTFVDQNSIWLSWLPPSDAGGRTDLEYRVSCDKCSKFVHFRPDSKGLKDTSMTILGLNPATTYRIRYVVISLLIVKLPGLLTLILLLQLGNSVIKSLVFIVIGETRFS